MSQDTLDAVWDAFCAQLAEAKSSLTRPDAPRDPRSQAEGVRYLSRLTRVALDNMVESGDPDFPRLFQMSNDTIKIGGDNPDNHYQNAVIAGDRIYRIEGKRNTIPYLSFGSKANRFATTGGMESTGELEDSGMHFEKDGSFEIIVSRDKPSKGNWLPTNDDTSMLLVRQTFLNKSKEVAADITIECLEGPAKPAPLTPEKIEAQLKRAAAFVRVTANSFADWSKMFMDAPNQLLPRDQTVYQKVGGDPNIHYLWGYWKLAPDEAWLIETEVPECRFWNFVLQNYWMESGDYNNIPNAWINPVKGKKEKDGRLVIVVSDTDPGFGNWIDTTGHITGTALLRWISAKTHPVPTCRVVKKADLGKYKP